MLARCHETPEETPWGCLSWGAGPVQVSIDPNGNLTTKTEGTDTWVYTWNAENQLTKVEKNGVEVARFSYDPLGRRVEKVTSGVTASNTYDGEDIVRENRGGATLKYLHGLEVDEPLGADDGASLSYFHSDGLGSVVNTTNGFGSVTLARQYDAWGNLETGGSESGYAFTGRDWDPETGLYYYRARYYDPRIGRFAGEDPIGFKGGLNLFAYVDSNPTTATDPTGLVGIRECLARMGGAAGAMYANWQRMEKAHVPNVDWYFHCMANCEGAQGDSCAAFATWTLSAGREAWGYAKWRFIHHMWTPWKTWAWDTAMDWTANDWGRRNSCPQRDCHKVCRIFLPNDLPPGFPR